VILKVFENDGRILGRREFETIRVDSTEDSDTFVGDVSNLGKLRTVLDRRSEKTFDDSTDAGIESVAES
jgi:hypothetical protein